MSTTTSTPQEQIFRAFTSEEGKNYATQRLAYPPELYKLVLDHHTSTGGRLDFLLDVGCGPGNSTRELALAFDRAMGVDASPGMIASAREIGGKTGSGGDVVYEVAPAEDLADVKALGVESVDLLTVANAAHWFDMPSFWRGAGKTVKPGGTLAIWARSFLHVHPSTLNAPQINQIMRRFREEILPAYQQAGHEVVRNYSENLIMPWDSTISCPTSISTTFPQSLHIKHDFDKDGVPDDGINFFGGSKTMMMEQVERLLSTGSPIVKWRALHPELVGTESDIVVGLVRELREVMRGSERDTVEVVGGTTIWLMKKVSQEEFPNE